MLNLKRLVTNLSRKWKSWLPPVVVGLVIVPVVLYTGAGIWQTAQEGTLNTLVAFLIFFAVCTFIVIVASPYRMEILVAVVGMVVGAVAGAVPYMVLAIILILLGLSTEGQATSRELSPLLNNEVFSQLFFVAGGLLRVDR